MASTTGNSTSGEPGAILFAQVMYDPDTTGAEADLEWITLFNVTAQSITLHGWTLRDSKSATLIPTFELPAHSLALLAPSDAARQALPNFDGVWVLLDGRIGNGLGNSGDQLSLRDGGGNLIDALSWGDDTAVFDPSVPLTAPGTPLSRQLPRDTDTADDWQALDEQGTSETALISPSDERSGQAVSVTHSVATAPGSSPADPSAGRLILSEVAAGRAWIELYNPTGQSVAPSGWSIDDDDPNSPPLALQLIDGVDAYSFALIDDPKLHSLSGGVLRLLRPDGTLADTLAATDIDAGTTWSRYPVQGGAWQPGTPPSPGTFNLAAAVPTPTTTPTTTPTPTTLANPDATVAERHAMTASGPRATVAGLVTRTALAGIGLGAALALLVAVYAVPRRRAPADFDASAPSGTDDSDRE